MKENLILILKGFILGIANVIPGVSGGTIAITLGIYERLISAVSHIRENLKTNIKFILFLGIGIILSIALFSNVIGFCLDKFPFATILFFIGFILGGMPPLLKKVKSTITNSNLLIFSITFSIVIIMTFLSAGDSSVSLSNVNALGYFKLFGCGIIAAATMVLPGISGSFVLMLLGYYHPIINTIRDLTKFNNIFNNALILGFLGIGILTGIVLAAKLIEWLLKKYETQTYCGIIGFIVASIISIFLEALVNDFGIVQMIFGFILLIVGVILSKKLSSI